MNQQNILKVLGHVATVLIFCCYGLLAGIPDLRLAVPQMIGLTALSTLFLAILMYGGAQGWVYFSPGTILLVAAGLRLLFVFDAPQLSDDAYRYLFDGLRLITGHNPYAFSPDDIVRQDSAMADLVSLINHSHLITIYPPGAQIVFAIGAVGRSIISVKLVLVLVDLFTIWVMLRLMSHLGLAPYRSIFYAWHPLAVLEIASSGHIDGVALMFVLSALCLLWPSVSRTSGNCSQIGLQAKTAVFLSGVLFSFAIGVKLLPVIFLPPCFLMVHRQRRMVFICGLVIAGLLLTLPFLPEVYNLKKTLGIYTATWEFSGMVFRFLRDTLNSGEVARMLLALSFIAYWIYCYVKLTRSISGASGQITKQFTHVLKVLYHIAFVFLLLTPTLHPWYGLYAFLFLPFFWNSAGIILSWTITLGYRVLIEYHVLGKWVEDDTVVLLIWAGPFLAFLLSFFIGAIRSKKYNNIAVHF